MSEYTDAMHDFVQASNRFSTARAGRELSSADCELAAAGDRLESVLRQMMREEARRLDTGLTKIVGRRS